MKALIEKMKEMDQAEVGLEHLFSGGMYLRDMVMHEGTALVGGTHTQDGIGILLEGTAIINKVEYTGPAIFETKKGSQRAFYAVTDIDYCTIHRTDETEVSVCESILIEETTPLIGVDL